MASVALLLLAPAAARAQTVRICAIQGPGAIPPMLGSRVSASGVVTADFQSSAGGFYMQEPGCDADAATSDGIFVSAPGRTAPLTVGNRVTVTGRVTNDAGLTALVLESLSDGGPYAGTLEAVRLSPPVDAVAAAAYLEAYEGMLVSLPLSRVVAATDHAGASYVMPDSSGVTRLFRGESDGRKLGLAVPGGWLMVSQGDRVSDVTGVLKEASGQFEVDIPPARTMTVERSGAVPPDAGSAAASLTVATLNLQGLFDTVDDPGKDDEVPAPADYASGLDRRANSIGRYLGRPDVIGVQEAEKIEVLQDLAALPSLIATGYRAVLVEGIDPRGLDVGLLYNSGRVRLRASEARPVCSALRPPSGPAVSCALSGGGSGFLLFTRPPLVARLEATDNGERLTVVVNHFADPSADPAADDQLRVAQADAVRALVDELKAAEPDVPVVVLGDFNAVEDSVPLQHLTAGGRLVNPIARSGSDRPYTHTVRGLCENVDHVLVDATLAPRVAEAKALHVNVDFGDPGPGAAPQASPRASDHDPVRVVLARR